MTQVHAPFANRAYNLRSRIKSPKYASLDTALARVIALFHRASLYVREDDGSIVPVQPKWACAALKAKRDSVRGVRNSNIFRAYLRDRFRGVGADRIVLSRREISYWQYAQEQS